MIFESLDQIKELINEPANPCMDKARHEHKRLNMLVNGEGVDEYIESYDGYESTDQKNLKKKVAKSTKHLFSALLRPFDKVFTSQGGSLVIDLPDAQKAQFKDTLSAIRYGQSFTNWMRTNWKNKFITDPNGLIFYEVMDGETYPTYKAITSIHDYTLSGNTPEYVISKSHKEDDGWEYYRVMDDAVDMVVRVKGEVIEEVDSYPNYWGYIPAHTCSDISDPNYEKKISPIDGVSEVAMEYLRDMTIHSVYKFLHGFPVFWRYTEDCPVCDGMRKIDGATCTYCSGTGKKLTRDVSEMVGLEPPAEGEASITPPAGYVQPDLATWQQQIDELDWLYTAMHFALWGTHTREEATAETATGRFIDTQPVNDRLNEFADSTESVMNAGINTIGGFYFPNWRGATYAVGRRFQIESQDALIERYQQGRKEGLPQHTLNALMVQVYQTMYENQPLQLAKMTKLMHIEPFLHMTPEQVNDLNVPRDDYLAKIYFAEWAESLSEQDIVFTSNEALKTQLITYIKTKQDEGITNPGVPGVEKS